jgi:hypothetical protein
VTSSNVGNITVSCAAPSPPTITSAPTLTLYVIGVSASTVTGTVVASDSAGRPISYSIASPASRGTATIDSSSRDTRVPSQRRVIHLSCRPVTAPPRLRLRSP